MVNPRDIHSTNSICHCKIFLLQISYDFIKKHIPNIDFIEFKLDYNKNKLHPSIEYMASLLKELSSLCQEKPNDYLLKFYSMIFDLLFHLSNNFKTKVSSIEQQKHEKYIERLSKVTYYVKKHYMDEISLTDISAVVSLNPEYFSISLKHKGITFLEYLNPMRLEYAYVDFATQVMAIESKQEWVHQYKML